MFVGSTIRRGSYYDSIQLMQIQSKLQQQPGVVEVAVVIGTPTNLALLSERGLLEEKKSAGPNDLVVAIRAESEASAREALSQLEGLIAGRPQREASGEYRPRSLKAAVEQMPEADWVLVSTPPDFAPEVAREALRRGRNVFLFSDNVELAKERELKTLAASKGLLLLGPDCGTAIVDGVGLGFANRVRRGGIAVVGSSGTGIQAVSSRIHALGAGVSQVFGTGGRDLMDQVGAVTTLQLLDLLRRDRQTAVIVVVSKPPGPLSVRRLMAAAQATGKPVVFYLIGYPVRSGRFGNVEFTSSFQHAAERASALADAAPERHPSAFKPAPAPYLRGLFSGGSLAAALLDRLQGLLDPLYSNAPLGRVRQLPDPSRSEGHTILDLGADEFTVGRLHPMMDQALLLERLQKEADDPETGVIALDVVLGEGAHPNPARELGRLIREVKSRRDLEILIMIVGTDLDPQNLEDQSADLVDSGARICRSLQELVGWVALSLSEAVPQVKPVALELGRRPLAAINVGLEIFSESIVRQDGRAVQVDWRPPAEGDQKLMEILEKLR